MLPGWKACMWQEALVPICRPKSAERIGHFFKKLTCPVLKICGNAALAGAVKILHDRSMEKEATALAERAKTINLGTSAKFQEFYMKYMMFDE